MTFDPGPLLQAAAQAYNAGNSSAAAHRYTAVLREDPDNPIALSCLSHIMAQRRGYLQSLAVARRAVELAPGKATPLLNLGQAMFCVGKHDAGLATYAEAEATLKQAVAIDSGLTGAWHSLGSCRHFVGDFKGAIDYFDQALAIEPKAWAIRNDKAISLLAMGEYAEGLKVFETRFNMLPPERKHPIWDSGIPIWRGEPIAGKTLVLHHEQGFGDSIMFARLVPRLRAMGVLVVMLMPVGLCRLFRQSKLAAVVDGDVGIVPQGDFHAPTFEAWRWLGEHTREYLWHDSPSYLVADPATNPLPAGAGKMRVGIVWNGLQTIESDRRRSAPLSDFFPLGSIPGVQLYSLQLDRGDELAANGVDTFIIDLAPHIRDFADTAALVTQLDLLISVDTAITHLAGALGVSCWILNDDTPCWRWPREGATTPWYRSVRLYHKRRPGGYGEVMDEVARDLRRLVEKADGVIADGPPPTYHDQAVGYADTSSEAA